VDDPASDDDEPVKVHGRGTTRDVTPRKHRTPASPRSGLVHRAQLEAINTARAKNTHVDPVHDGARKPDPHACTLVLPFLIDNDCVVSQQRPTTLH
jgi:hypothetical protein